MVVFVLRHKPSTRRTSKLPRRPKSDGKWAVWWTLPEFRKGTWRSNRQIECHPLQWNPISSGMRKWSTQRKRQP